MKKSVGMLMSAAVVLMLGVTNANAGALRAGVYKPAEHGISRPDRSGRTGFHDVCEQIGSHTYSCYSCAANESKGQTICDSWVETAPVEDSCEDDV